MSRSTPSYFIFTFTFICSNGILKEGMDLVNYIIILGKTHLWTCRQKGIEPNFEHFKKILELKYETEKYIAFMHCT